VPLCDSFEEEAEKIMEQINTTFDVVYSSPLTRCMQLAQKISSIVKTDPRLMELNFGDWESKFWNDIDQTPEAQQWFADYVNTPAPNGESYAEMIQRCKAFVNEIKAFNYKNICIVSHGGTIRAIKAIIEGTPPEEAFNLKIEYGEILKIEI
nr:alpha-ribazole phosphatase family protein [Prolixibacteraceae bacterium]